ncbi:MAG: PAS domain-containing protein [Acetobacteraceae bacterium]|nr:PAS domain-containing protein [Acetobacteraceae bacterium]
MKKPATAVVGIGASAGGVEALSSFFHAVPPDSGLAYVVVTHLGPGRDSLLPEILAKAAPIPVRRAADGEVPEANHVYTLATAATLTLVEGRLHLQAEGRRPANPIDVFLASLAEDRAEHAVGVVLSGGGGDGTLGLKAVKERGGLTVAQGSDGIGPQHHSMPDSAIAAGNVDLILPVEEIPARLVRYAAGLAMLEGLAAPQPESPAAALRDSRRAICQVLRNQVGHDFSGYKESTFLRRVQRRMQVLQIDTAAGYLDRLRRDPQEASRLFRDLLIGVTSFFRDADAFEALERLVVPALFEGRGADGAVRVWVPGCATGEEAYSLAILLRERMLAMEAPPRVQIFATDIDDGALTVARAGRYPATMLDGVVPPERQARFFTADGETMVLRREVRDLCVFSSHSVVRDPPFSRMDLVSCRNLLIYLDNEVQRRVVPVFHYALRPGGYLFLGTAEGIGSFGELFAPLEQGNRIFRRRDHATLASAPVWLPEIPNAATPTGAAPRAPPGAMAAAAGGGGPERPIGTVPTLRHQVERRLLERFAPAHVVVNREADVVHFSAGTGRFLEAAAGAPGRNLLAMARRGLRLDLRAVLLEARETRQPARRSGVVMAPEDRMQPVTITVEPLGEDAADPLFLVLFEEAGPPRGAETPEGGTGGAAREPGAATARLEEELREVRDRLQSTIEEYETALEELKSANEEMVSMNEELQSASEELQTANEEQQSINEELHTVNTEMGAKIDALDRANADLGNLFENTRIATVFLDRQRLIRSFTPTCADIFHLLPGDVGRPLTDITCMLDYPELHADIEEVLRTGAPRERPVQRQDGRAHHLARLAAYRDTEGRIDGVLATFAEITSVVRAEAHQRMMVAELNHRVKNSLAVVVGIAIGSLPAGPARDAFIARLKSLSRAHELLSEGNWSSVRLAEILRGEAAPYAMEGHERLTLSGPEVLVSPRMAQSLALVVHELATNAAKYGALSVETGHVAISWTLAEAGAPVLRLVWREIGGPAAAPPTRRGFGSRVIQREVTAGLAGRLRMEFAPDGLEPVIEVPLERRAAPHPAPRPGSREVAGQETGADPSC